MHLNYLRSCRIAPPRATAREQLPKPMMPSSECVLAEHGQSDEPPLACHPISMTKTVSITNQKGGVGKTTTTLGLASAAQAAGDHILVVDMDPQASATYSLGVDASDKTLGVSDVLVDPKLMTEAIVESGWGTEIYVLPASRILASRERENTRNADLRLRRALDELPDEYRLVLIDTPPSLGHNTLNALGAADFVLIVIELATHSLRGLTAVLDTIDEVWAELNPDLDIAGVLPNRVPPVSTEAERRFDELAEMVGRKAIWKPSIPQRALINQAAGDRQAIHSYGYRARDVAELFEAHYARLRRLTH
jgi:chromosome partitioning protein